MKKLTLIALAALFVSVTSFAQSKAITKPLSQKKLEAVTKLAGKNFKKQPSQKSLQRVNDIERQKSKRATLTTAWQKANPGKSIKDFKNAKATNRAAAGPIYDQPAGTEAFYTRSGSAYYVLWGYVYSDDFSGSIGNVVTDGNTVYFKNIISQFPEGTWTKGTINGSTIEIDFPQAYLSLSGETYYTYMLGYDATEQWFMPTDDQKLVLNYNAATGAITTPEGSAFYYGETIVGLCTEGGEWQGYADWNMTYEKVTDELVQAPADLKTEQYALTANGYEGSLVNVGIQGNDIYVQGLHANLPESWVKGTINGNKVSFKTGQYLGPDESINYHTYLMSATSEEKYDEDYGEWYTEYTLTDADITFDYDPATKRLSQGTTFLVNAAKDKVYYVSAFSEAVMTPFTEVAATPAAPTDLQIAENGFTYFNMGWGWGEFGFNLTKSDADGNYILPEKLSYVLWAKVNGEDKQLSFSPYDYVELTEEMTEIPYDFTEEWDFYISGAMRDIYYHTIGFEALGVQTIYRGAGEERRSEIQWISASDIGSEIQPDKATPEYPEATIGENDNRIGFGYYTGEEQVGMTTNASKPETYDVAVKIDDAATVGTLIESITFPLASIEGISDVSVFLTSQLRVENEKNAADLVTKAVTPTEPGFITVKLDKPYTIPAGGVYVGYSFTVNDVNSEENQYPVAVMPYASPNGYFLHTSGGIMKWINMAEGVSANALIQVSIAGSAVKKFAASPVPAEEQYVMTGQTFNVPFTVVNHGAEGISSLDIEYEVAGLTGTEHFDVNPAVAGFFGKTTQVTLNIPAINEKGNYSLQTKVVKVNGVTNEDAAIDGFTPVVVLNTVPKHRAVLEEYTGFWCGWCPRGFVALEKLAELYPDEYVLMSYHNEDELEIMPSANYPSYVAGFPSAWIDRVQDVDPYYGSGENNFGIENDLAARNQVFGCADIDFTSKLSEDGNQVIVNTKVTFPYDITDNQFMLSYALVEDGLTDPSWSQSNYYSGDSGVEDFQAFYEAGSSVTGLTFNDVVVMMPQSGGIEGSLPETITADVPVEHTFTFDLNDALNTSWEPIIQDKSKLKVVVLLIKDAWTGEIANANVAKVGEATGISIREAGKDNISSVVYYDLAGRKIANPKNGVFVKSVQYKNGQSITRKVVMK